MPRLIDADRLKKDILDLPNCYNGFSDTYDKACVIGIIDEQPTIEPERQTGHWIEWLDVDNEGTWECSVCKEPWTLIAGTPADNDMNFCPKCGALMSESLKEGGAK